MQPDIFIVIELNGMMKYRKRWEERIMAKGEIIIKEAACLGCGVCQKFCAHGCIVMSKDKFTPQGSLLPEFIKPDECNACGICEWMCPHFAIEVYKYIDSATKHN